MPRRSRGLCILLVDDDPLVLAATSDLLEELGHLPRAVASGEAALALLGRDEVYDLLLTDHLMPGLPILPATGFAEHAARAGLEWPQLRKPYNLSDLSARLEALEPGGRIGFAMPVKCAK